MSHLVGGEYKEVGTRVKSHSKHLCMVVIVVVIFSLYVWVSSLLIALLAGGLILITSRYRFFLDKVPQKCNTEVRWSRRMEES